MLGWALKRNVANGKDASGPDDDTVVDQPDTPAPVFAVRALKTALFGTPAPQQNHAVVDASRKVAARKQSSQGGSVASASALAPSSVSASDPKSPAKPPGILLTPGTGAARRKRVSFGHDVKPGEAGQQAAAAGVPEELPSLFSGEGENARQARPRTALTQALENARKGRKQRVADSQVKSPATDLAARAEEPHDDMDDPEDDPDVTVDLNEPHSHSGKYWKSCFETYHAEAKAEMEKLVKYKQLAKSYAKMKDSEALDISRRLKEEQEKVKQMEKQVSEMTRLVASQAKDNGGACDGGMLDNLAKQTALAMEYREQVQGLEALLQDGSDQEFENRPKRRTQDTSQGTSSQGTSQGTSPRTQRTLLETQRELRKARAQVIEIERLSDEVKRLKVDLLSTEQRSARLADENKRLASDLSQRSSKILELEKKLDETRAEGRQKDRELRRLRSEHDQLKDNAKTRFFEAEQVLQRKNDKISGLKSEIRGLEALAGPRRMSRVREAEMAWRTGHDDIGPKGRGTTEALTADTEGEAKESRLITDASRQPRPLKTSRTLRTSSNEGHIADFGSKRSGDMVGITAQSRYERRQEASGKGGQDEEVAASSSSSALSDRGNLQETRPSATRPSATRPSVRHSYPSRGTAATPPEPALLPWKPDPEALAGPETQRRLLRSYVEGRGGAAAARPPSRGDDDDRHIDLVQGNFARLGGPPDANASMAWSVNTSRTTLTKDRHAAAIARLAQKKAERAGRAERAKRMLAQPLDTEREERDKENLLLS